MHEFRGFDHLKILEAYTLNACSHCNIMKKLALLHEKFAEYDYGENSLTYLHT